MPPDCRFGPVTVRATLPSTSRFMQVSTSGWSCPPWRTSCATRPTSGAWATMGVCSDGAYDIPEGLIFGLPCTCADGRYRVIKGLEIDTFSKERIALTLKELVEEREAVKHLLG